MIGISFGRILRTALQNLWRNLGLSITTTVIMVITLLMLSFLYFANVVGAEALRSIEGKVDLLVNFKDNVQQQYIDAVANELRARQDVASVRVISSEEALENFRQVHADESTIEESLREIGDNPLPASLFIVATDPRFYETIAKQLQSEKYTPFIAEVRYDDSQTTYERLIQFVDAVQQFGVILTTVFSLLVIMIVFNTVRLAIYSFREEIDIMRLVGASRWFIQGPFIIEAMIIAVVAVLISIGIQYPTLKAAAPRMQSYFFGNQADTLNIYSYVVENWVSFIGIQLLLALFLAFFSSFLAVRRYLKD